MPSVQSFLDSTSELKPTAAAFVSTRPVELIPSVASGCNLQILYRYTRSTHLYSPSMVNIELTLTNSGAEDLADIHMITKVSMRVQYVIDFSNHSTILIENTLDFSPTDSICR